MPVIPTHPLQDFEPLQFKIERINYVNQYDPGDYHRHAYFEIFLFREGGGYHDIDFERVPVQPASVHFISPGQVHRLNRAPDSSGFVLLFSAAFLADTPGGADYMWQYPLFFHRRHPPVLCLSNEEFSHLLFYIESMLLEFNNQHSQKKRILQSYLHIFLCRCQHWVEHEQPQPEPSPAYTLWQRCRERIEQHFTEWHQVGAYAQALHVTARQLNHAAEKYEGKTVARLIQERLVLEARRRLRFTNDPIGQIAFDLGFEDVAHFSKFFRQHNGQSPSHWRQRAVL
jgi:AraC family transcriptional regulator, transcriptional activator of pobA